MRGHGLRVLQSAAGFEIGGDARGAEGMAACPGTSGERHAKRLCALRKYGVGCKASLVRTCRNAGTRLPLFSTDPAALDTGIQS